MKRLTRYLAAFACALAAFPAGRAPAHGSGEIEIFSYLLDEPGFLRITALILGALIFLLGAFIAHQGRREWRRLREDTKEPASSALKLTAPGIAFSIVGAAIMFAAVFILPDRIDTGRHDHPASEARSESQPDGKRK